VPLRRYLGFRLPGVRCQVFAAEVYPPFERVQFD
jgi:hypothetical protein